MDESPTSRWAETKPSSDAEHLIDTAGPVAASWPCGQVRNIGQTLRMDGAGIGGCRTPGTLIRRPRARSGLIGCSVFMSPVGTETIAKRCVQELVVESCFFMPCFEMETVFALILRRSVGARTCHNLSQRRRNKLRSQSARRSDRCGRIGQVVEVLGPISSEPEAVAGAVASTSAADAATVETFAWLAQPQPTPTFASVSEGRNWASIADAFAADAADGAQPPATFAA